MLPTLRSMLISTRIDFFFEKQQAVLKTFVRKCVLLFINRQLEFHLLSGSWTFCLFSQLCLLIKQFMSMSEKKSCTRVYKQKAVPSEENTRRLQREERHR